MSLPVCAAAGAAAASAGMRAVPSRPPPCRAPQLKQFLLPFAVANWGFVIAVSWDQAQEA